MNGNANIARIKITNDGTKTFYQGNWGVGYTQIIPFKVGPTSYIFRYRGGTGRARITKITGSGENIDAKNVWSGRWAGDYSNIVLVQAWGRDYLLAHQATTGYTKTVEIDADSYDVNNLITVGDRYWSKSWTAFSPFYHGFQEHVLLYNLGTSEIRTIRLLPDGSDVETLWSKSWLQGWK